MPARVTKIRHDENTRAKIKAARIIELLQEHMEGTRDMSASAVSAGLGLLRKTLPDLASVAHTGEDGGPLQVQVVRFTEGE